MSSVTLDHVLFEEVLAATGATGASGMEFVQELWSGYGRIVRVKLVGADVGTVVVKQICPPDAARGSHPRGWNTDISHQRKLQSYEVEAHWYQTFAPQCSDTCRVPRCLGVFERDGVRHVVLEDLDAAGFAVRSREPSVAQIHACLRWLAEFHATFMGSDPQGLWPEGTYWHLDTRPDELAALTDDALRAAAPKLDHKLKASSFRTLVHGDAKVANFCFSAGGQDVAAVDFQYIGGGCGMKDVAYFISSCLSEDEAEKQEQPLLEVYFTHLREALRMSCADVDVDELERQWRELYPIAWADFYRFLCGWSPGHWKIHRYSERLTREALEWI